MMPSPGSSRSTRSCSRSVTSRRRWTSPAGSSRSCCAAAPVTGLHRHGRSVFLALMKGQRGASDDHWHFGLVVCDRGHVRALAEAAGATLLDGPFLDFLDPCGNRVEVVDYKDIQFTKAPNLLHGMSLDQLSKSDRANKELADKGLG